MTRQQRGFTLIEVVIVIAIIAIIASIAIPSLTRSRSAANESNAQNSLLSLRTAEATWYESDSDQNGVKDYWTADVAGLYGLEDNDGQTIRAINLTVATADGDPAQAYAALSTTGRPRAGFLYEAMDADVDGTAYAQDPDGDGNATSNTSNWAFTAYPSNYPQVRNTFIVNVAGAVFKKDNSGNPQLNWPHANPPSQGWLPAGN